MDNARTCGQEPGLTSEEVEALTALPDRGHEFQEFPCGLQAGHAGPHLALGQIYGSPDRERWLRWTAAGTREWFDIGDSEHCPAEGRPLFEKGIAEDWVCWLPDVHPGKHSFEMR
jgi:hypothetical protein